MSADGLEPAEGRAIALCGFMGVGKSAIGKVLATKLGRTFFDSDAELESQLGTTISNLFAQGQEQYFREQEQRVITELIERRPAPVVALGGGAMERQATRELLLDNALVVFIDQPWEQLAPALKNLRVSRPLLVERDEDQVHELFLARQANYRAAHITVVTSRQGVKSAAQRVIEAINVRDAENNAGHTSNS